MPSERLTWTGQPVSRGRILHIWYKLSPFGFLWLYLKQLPKRRANSRGFRNRHRQAS